MQLAVNRCVPRGVPQARVRPPQAAKRALTSLRLGLVAAGRARAWLRGGDYVLPEDLKALAPDILRHRLVLTYEASVRGVDADEVVGRVLDHVTVP